LRQFPLDTGTQTSGEPALSPTQIADLKARIDAGEKKAKIAREMGISRETLYQYLRQPLP
jgi:DNA-binding phage protein